MMSFKKLNKTGKLLGKVRESFKGGLRTKISNNSSSFISLRVLRVGTWFMVHHPLDIQKINGYPMGCRGQRLLMNGTNGNRFLKLNMFMPFPNLSSKF